jgi:hypothetical protein
MKRYMIVLAYLGSQCTEFHAADFYVLLFGVVYLTWGDFEMGSDKETASNFVQISEKL